MLGWRVCAATSLLKFTAKALPTSDTHYTRRRRFNAEKANLFSDIKQPAQFSSHLAFRNSLLIYLVTYNFTVQAPPTP
jgi:hypothetical protein